MRERLRERERERAMRSREIKDGHDGNTVQ